MTKTAAIIGAGVAGITCALELEKDGYAVQLFDRNEKTGGRLQTEVRDQRVYDHGFQVLLTAYPYARKLLNFEQLKLKSFVPGARIFNKAKCMRLSDPRRDIKGVLSTAFSGIGSLKDKLNVIRLSSELSNKSSEEIFEMEESSTLEFLENYGFSGKIIQNFFKPFFTGIFLEDQLQTSSRKFCFVFKMFTEGKAAIPEAGIAAIPNQLFHRLKNTVFEGGSAVQIIDNKTIELEDGEPRKFDLVIDARPATQHGEPEWKSCDNLYVKTQAKSFGEPMIGLIADDDSLVNNFHFMEDLYGPQYRGLISLTVVKKHELPDDVLLLRIKKNLLEHAALEVGDVVFRKKIEKALPGLSDLKYVPDGDALVDESGLFHCGDYLANGSLNAAMASGELAAKEAIRRGE